MPVDGHIGQAVPTHCRKVMNSCCSAADEVPSQLLTQDGSPVRHVIPTQIAMEVQAWSLGHAVDPAQQLSATQVAQAEPAVL